MKKLVIASVVLLTTACSAQFTKTGDSSFSASEINCDFSVYTTPPSQPFDEIGLIEFKAIPFVGFPRSISKVKEEASPLVCENGGNGLLVWESNGMGQYLKATIIRFKS